MRRAWVSLSLVVCAMSLPAFAPSAAVATRPPAGLDRGFADGGILRLGNDRVALGMATGRGGTYVLEGDSGAAFVSHYFPDGSPAPGYAASTTPVNQAFWGGTDSEIAVDSHRRVILLRNSSVGPMEVLRLTPDGRLDPSFGVGGTVYIPLECEGVEGQALAAGPEGDVTVENDCAEFAGYGVLPNLRVHLIRLADDGYLDYSYGTGGEAIATVQGARDVTAFAMLPNGGVSMGVRKMTQDAVGVWRGAPLYLLWATPDGKIGRASVRPVRTWPLARRGSEVVVKTLIPQGRGRVVVIGETEWSFHAGARRAFAIRILPGGRGDRRFGHRGWSRLPQDYVEDLPSGVADRRGRIYVAIHPAREDETRLLRLTADGRRDRSFNRGRSKVLPQSSVETRLVGFGFNGVRPLILLNELIGCRGVCLAGSEIVRFYGGPGRSRHSRGHR